LEFGCAINPESVLAARDQPNFKAAGVNPQILTSSLNLDRLSPETPDFKAAAVNPQIVSFSPNFDGLPSGNTGLQGPSIAGPASAT
jgi:hypothetical protein